MSLSKKNSNNEIVYPAKGVDLSAYQSNISYKALKDAGVSYAILKVMRRDGSVDKKYYDHYKGLMEVGIPVTAVYNYSYANTMKKAVEGAKRVIGILENGADGTGKKNNSKIAICMDVEDECMKGLGKGLADIINIYEDVVLDADFSFLVYTGLSFYNSYIKPYKDVINCDKWWIARYYNGYTPMPFREEPSGLYKPKLGSEEILGWQYTSSGRIPGYSGNLDLNIVYKEINDKLNLIKGKPVRTRSTPKPSTGPNIRVRE